MTPDELMASTRYDTGIDLASLTGVRELHVAGAGEDSYTLALDAAQDALAHAGVEHQPSRGRTAHTAGATGGVQLKHELGADRALSFVLSNA